MRVGIDGDLPAPASNGLTAPSPVSVPRGAMSHVSIPENKDRLRTLLYKRRAVAAKHAGANAGAHLADHVLAMLAGSVDGRVISAFLPIRTEIDTRPLIAKFVAADATVVLPAIVGDSPDLVFRAWRPGEPLATGAFDVEEPLVGSPEHDPQILIIPLLAFDRAGYRLGYGGGYYDRVIARLRPNGQITTVGIAFDEQEVVHVPREIHDERLDAIVTPDRVLEFGGR